MNKIEIEKLLNDLDYGNPDDIKENAFNKLKTLEGDDLKYLIWPKGSRCWSEVTKILNEADPNKIKFLINDLLDWLYDINIDGGTTIVKILNKFKITDIINKVEEIVIDSIKKKDDVQLYAIHILFYERNDVDQIQSKIVKEVLKMDAEYDWDKLNKLLT